MIRAIALAAGLTGSAACAQQSCFARTYSDAHLLTQPQQTVRSMQVVFSGLAEGPGGLGDHASVAVRFRSDPRQWTTGLVCYDPTHCAVECDGGVFSVRWKGRNTILLTTSGFIVGVGCDGDESGDQTRTVIDDGAATTTYLLKRASMTACPAEFLQ